MKLILSYLLARIASEIVYALIGFDYDIFDDAFNAGQAAIWFAIFVPFVFAFDRLLEHLFKFFKSRKQSDQDACTEARGGNEEG